MLLKVSHWKGVVRFIKRGKLSPRYVGPFEIFQVKKCLADESLVVPVKDIEVNEKLKFVEKPLQIEDRKVKNLKHKRLVLVKVKCDSKRGPEYTWELESEMQRKYPHLFQ